MIKSLTYFGAILGSLSSAHAFLVAGANGVGSENTTLSDLNSSLGTDFPYFDHVVRQGAGSMVYLGTNPTTSELWFLSSQHFNAIRSGNSFNFEGSSYTVNSNQTIGGADLRLISAPSGGNNPGLQAVNLAMSVPTLGDEIIMLGTGRQRVQPGSTDPFTSDAVALGNGFDGYTWQGQNSRIKRWGTNTIDLAFGTFPTTTVPVSISSVATTAFTVDFTEPSTILGEWTTSNEGQGTSNDSGGGAFTFVNGEWVLSGLASAITVADVTGDGDGDLNNSAFSDGTPTDYYGTIFTDISTFKDDINAITGVLVPEPSSSLLASFGLLFVLRRRR
jgi:hypothetical protein